MPETMLCPACGALAEDVTYRGPDGPLRVWECTACDWIEDYEESA